MGTPFSKKPSPPLDAGGSGSSRRSSRSGHGSANAETPNSSGNNDVDSSSNEADRQRDPELQTFEATVQQRTIGAISIFAGSELNSISLDTLRQVTGCLIDNNQEVVKMILEYKKDIWKNPELFDLVEEYFDNSLRMMDFCTALEKCLKRARDSQLIVQVALKHFEEEEEHSEEHESSGSNGKKKYKRTLEELQHFKAAGNPFTEEFSREFQLVYRQQVSMLGKLLQKKAKLDKKLKTVKAWRRVSRMIFVSAFAALLICSVVAAIVAAPPVAAALAAAAAVPMGSVGKWIDSLWKRYGDVLQGQGDLFSTMQGGTVVAIRDLDSIRILVDRFEIQINALMGNVDFALRNEEAVKFGVEEIKKKLGEFMMGVEDLGKQVDRCSRNIQWARTVVLQRILKPHK